MQSKPASPFLNARLFGLIAIAIGVAAWWYNAHLAATSGSFYIKLCVLAPLAVFGGLLFLVRPQWAGPLGSDSTRAHKIALGALVGAMFVSSGIEFFRLKNMRPRPAAVVRSFSPRITNVSSTMSPAVSFLGKTWNLRSFNQKNNATWEFTSDESIDDWSTLLTVVDRPDARSREELDRLAEGIMSNYKSHNGRVLLAKTMRDASGNPFNYMVVAFEQRAKRRFELNFVKVTLGATNAAVVVYGVRISDPADYTAKAKAFLDDQSATVGRAMESFAVPDLHRLPRREF